TYLGGSANDYIYGLEVANSGSIYVAGQTFSSDFPVTSGAFQTSCGGGNCTRSEGFIAELNANGSALIYSTYLGGSRLDRVNAIALDSAGNVYATGSTQSTDFPVTTGVLQGTCKCAGSDVFLAKLNPGGSALVYSTYL